MKITDEELRELEALIDEERREAASDNILDFTKYTMPEFEPCPFHIEFYDILNKFAKGLIKKLIVAVPPQHGKSEGASRRLPAFLLGLNPKLKIALASYNATFSSKFNRQVQRIMDSEEYLNVFPDTKLNGGGGTVASSSWVRNSDEFEIVDHGGFFKTVGVGGGLSGTPVDIALMDDLYKDYQDATSPVVSERVWDWYTTVVRSRLHNDSQELIVFTRWDDNDLIGRLEQMGKVVEYTGNFEDLNLEDDQFLKINFEAIKESPKNEIDQREKGEALWKERHSIDKLIATRELDPQKFSSLYQGSPTNKEGLMYAGFNTYDKHPQFKSINAYVDVADTGSDYLCCVVYGVPRGNHDEVYVLDVLYTQESMEVTEISLPEMLINNNVRVCHIESNNGGRGFGRVIAKNTPNSVNIKLFTQSENKVSRIYSNSGSVSRTIIMPSDWAIRFPEYHRDMTKHKKDAKNKHDDAADTTTGVYEKDVFKKNTTQILW